MAYAYSKNKKFIYQWRENNLEKKKELDRKHRRKYEMWKRERMIFLGILLD